MGGDLAKEILDIAAKGQVADACTLVAKLPDEEESADLLERLWWASGEPRFASMSAEWDHFREAVRARLQKCDMQLGRHYCGAARCPICIQICQFQAGDVCDHFLGVDSSELEVQEMVNDAGDAILQITSVLERVEVEEIPMPPARLFPAGGKPDGSDLGSNAVRRLLRALDCRFVRAIGGDGEWCQVVFAEDGGEVCQRLTGTAERLGAWARRQSPGA
jgi:hypothetical protein